MSAKKSCRETDSHLASILSLNGLADVRSLELEACGSYPGWWNGLKLDFYWSDESPYNDLQEPTKGGDAKRCVRIKNTSSGFVGGIVAGVCVAVVVNVLVVLYFCYRKGSA
jgi:hypothetical protein